MSIQSTMLLWGKPAGSAGPLLRAFATGAERHGYGVQWRNPKYATDTDGTSPDVAVVLGWKGNSRLIAEAYMVEGIPVVCLELGYLRRASATRLDCYRQEDCYYQVGVGGPCRLPSGPCPGDRFTSLGITPQHHRARRGNAILILGQVPSDGQHGLSGADLLSWYLGAVGTMREQSERPILFRPHPQAPILGGWRVTRSIQVTPADEPLSEAFARANVAVTVNSTSGTEAMIAAVPVICDPCAMYAPWCETDLTRVESPRRENRMDYFRRLAYAQWTLAEMRSGAAWEYVETQL